VARLNVKALHLPDVLRKTQETKSKSIARFNNTTQTVHAQYLRCA